MRRILPALCLAVAATVCGGAYAQPSQPPSAANPAERMQRFNERMAHLKERLQITSAQEGAWSAFVQAMQPQGHREPNARERHQQAVHTLYTQLNPEQQKVLDEVVARMQRHEHHAGGAMPAR